jgi:hypothetical protein
MKVWSLLAGVATVTLLAGFDCIQGGSQAVCGDGFNRATGSGEFGETEDARRVEEFLDAVARFDAEATTLIGQAEDVCRAIGQDIGVDDADMPVGDAATTCTAVSEKMQADMQAFQAADVEMIVEVALPECTASLDVAAECYARCEAELDVEVTPPTCTGGEVYVGCDVGCRGECHLPEVTAECHGSCEGTCTGGCTGSCTGQCSGACQGWCEGECDAFDRETGECVGTCTGTCHGECDATCEGACYGTCEGSCDFGCVVDVEGGGCEGECWGTCEADIEPIRCQGGDVQVDASVECEAACEAEIAFEAECTEPYVFIGFVGDTEALIELANAYAATLEANLPALIDLVVQMGVVIEATVDLVEAFGGGVQAAINLSAKAAACAIDAVSITVEVDIEFSATVNATASVATSLDVDTGVEGREH